MFTITSVFEFFCLSNENRPSEWELEPLMTYELCQTAVNNGLALRYPVPENLRTRELCLAAVVNDARALQCVPDILLRRIALPRINLTQE